VLIDTQSKEKNLFFFFPLLSDLIEFNCSNGNDNGDNNDKLKRRKKKKNTLKKRLAFVLKKKTNTEHIQIMNNAPIRPDFAGKNPSEIIQQFQQMNPQMYARLQSIRPQLFETANQHLLASFLTANTGRHGHGHQHSSSCNHSHSAGHFSQPVPEPPPKPDANSMNIIQAVQYNELDRVKQLIESNEAQVNRPDDEGCYLIHWAAINNHVEIIRYLISRGATVDIKGGTLQSTPLHWACMLIY